MLQPVTSGRRRAPAQPTSTRRSATLATVALAAAAGIALTAFFPSPEVSPTATPTAGDGPAVAAPVTADVQAVIDFGRESPQATTATKAPKTTVLSTPVDDAAFAPPIKGAAIASSFGYRVNPMGGFGNELHTGTDYAGACGTPVLASRAGTVVESGWHAYGGGQRIGVDHGGGLETSYNHLSVLGVNVGTKVSKGQNVGAVGNTGNSTGCHLHFELLVDGEKVDPQSRL
ncbi:murein DD-endopeptidase MepM/ murein hydrolase activator NlpD [Arthrobacter sp. CAN_A212]|uniref:M23 family metallopeptidase n=1 Tax=unclassified Arthrobacter TaxID=235627 RepID=UPI001A271CF7|nr:M23 family metallopeptidase [Arthrobacter sp. CAN_C5]MBP2215352.1 murein DD-endopeptidase MepM/ murein hydrolase activator NlpD [Arthrobacter sp. CAN_C5]